MQNDSELALTSESSTDEWCGVMIVSHSSSVCNSPSPGNNDDIELSGFCKDEELGDKWSNDDNISANDGLITTSTPLTIEESNNDIEEYEHSIRSDRSLTLYTDLAQTIFSNMKDDAVQYMHEHPEARELMVRYALNMICDNLSNTCNLTFLTNLGRTLGSYFIP